MKPWITSAAGLLLVAACDPDAEPPAPSPSRVAASTIPNPTVDPAAQKLDGGLGPAYAALKAGRFDEARRLAEEYTRSRGAAAHAGQAQFVIGLAFHRQMFFDAASEHFLRALALEPGFLETYYYAGLALFNVGRLEEARAAFAVYARHKPDDHAAAFGQGLVEIEADRVDEAERFLGRAIELAAAARAREAGPSALDGDLGRYHARLGDVALRRDDFARARGLFERAAALRPDSPEVWSKLALACERLGDSVAAKAAREKAEETQRRRTQGGPR